LPKREIAEQLVIGDIDLAVTLSTIQAPTIRSEILAAVKVMAVMQESDPLAVKSEISPADLAGRTIISYGAQAEVQPALQEAFAQAGVPWDVQIQISSSVGAAPLVSGGLGIALVDGLVAWHDFRGLTARPFTPAVTMNMAISTNSARPVSRFYKQFLGCLRALL
jgi:DNA-binding transcriptional LysR family regulator